MSRIYFHSESGGAELLGSERAWMSSLADRIGLSMVDGHMLRNLAEWLPFDLFGKTIDDFRSNAELVQTAHLAFRHDGKLTYQGVDLDGWLLNLNTAIRLGSTAVQLAARIHAQCEMHGWVDGPNRAWLADAIRDGQVGGVLRTAFAGRDPGWGSAIDLLRSRDDEPVVMSYSTGDGFPNGRSTTFTAPEGYDGDAYDAWAALPDDEAWRMGVDYLRAHPGMLEIEPEGFSGYHFGMGGLTWLDMIAGESRTREVLELEAQP